MTSILIVLGILGFAVLAIAMIIARLIYICPPNEVLIFSGGPR